MSHKRSESRYSNLAAVLYNYLQNQRQLTISGPPQHDSNDTTESILSVDSWVLAQELEAWLFQTPEGKSWIGRRMNPVKTSDPDSV